MTQIPITKFESSKLTNKFNDASCVTHPNPTTLFATAEGAGRSFLEARFDDEQDVNNLAISFPRGRDRKTFFSVLYIDGKDNYKKVEPSPFFNSSGDSQNTQTFYFKKVKAKGVRLVFLGNADNELFQTGNGSSQPRTAHARTFSIKPSSDTVDIGPNKQIFSIRKLSVGFAEDGDNYVEKIEEKEDDICESCQFCGNNDKSTLKDGVCQACKNTCHVNSNRVPFQYVGNVVSPTSLSSNNFGGRDNNDDRGIKGVRRHDHNSGNGGPIVHFAENPMITAMGHRDLPTRDNYTNFSTHSNLVSPQERPQIIFKQTEIHRTFIPSANGDRYDQTDQTRNVISSATPRLNVPSEEEIKQIVENRRRTEEERNGKPNGDININVRDLEKEKEKYEASKPSISKKQSSTTSKSNKKDDSIVVSPTPIKEKSDDSKVKIVKEKEVNEEKLDPEIAKTFDDFLAGNDDAESLKINGEEPELPVITRRNGDDTDTINNFNDYPELSSPSSKNVLEAPGKADLDKENKKLKTK